ncbi:DUF5004 domain-containing protein [Fulvivirga sp. M361]|nr:DUF5004 domain-containing protein [Fulvivirga sp. M361]
MIMKIIKIYIPFVYLMLALSVLLSGCIDDSPEIGEPFNRTSEIAGTWTLTKVMQNDEDAISKGFPAFVQSLEVTQLFPFEELVLSLGFDDQGNPSNFQVNPGDAPNIVDALEGTWTLDDMDAPSELQFENGNTLNIETYLGLGDGILNLKLTRYQVNSKNEKIPFLSYQYEFIKQ